MKKLLLAVCALFGFMACTQNPIEEQSAIRTDAPETIKVGFEDNETRIQLNEAQKTVWTKDDLVSVFYKSDANQMWEYRGETGERVADLYRVDAGTASSKMSYVVLVYPYSTDYVLSTASGNIETTLPATQHYAADSYAVGENLMVSRSEFTQFSLKSVCGWLKLQLTGNGEVVNSIKFRGNNGEQVAGLIYVDTETAEATLASEMGGSDDNNAGGNLIFDDTVVTEVTLDCGEGVTLGAEATSFYIALPPQTFANGFTVDIRGNGYNPIFISTSNVLVIERNTIQPMASIEAPLDKIAYNEIWYTNGSTTTATTPNKTDVFGASIVSNTYDTEKECWVIKFDSDVTTIGENAFYGCSSLTSVTIPDSVTTIGNYAFRSCSSLTSVAIPDSVTSIGDYAFSWCQSLTSVTIPDSVTSIGKSAFYGCSSLTSVTIPDSVTSIGMEAFKGCTGELVVNCNIPDGYYNNGEHGVFIGSKFTSVTIGDSVTTIGDYAFNDSSSLSSITIPDSVTTIGREAFEDCSSLSSITIPDSVTSIGNYAFYNCSSLTCVTIGSGVTSIGGHAFDNCSNLTEFKGNYVSDDGRCLIIDGTLYSFLPAGLTEYTIPDSVTTIGDYAFYNCRSLTSITIPDSVTTIGSSAFSGCNSLTSVTIPGSVTTIGEEAFYSCSSLTSVTIPDSVTTIGNYVFYECSSLTSVTIGDGVTTIGGGAFKGCSSLTKVTIPKSVTTIGIYTFDNCSSLVSVTIPDSVTTIWDYVFNGCSSLTSVTIPDSVTTIEEYAFCGCSSLTNLTIPDSVTSIGFVAFLGCSSLTSVTIGSGVTSIGQSAFDDCSSLSSVYCMATTPPWMEYGAFENNDEWDPSTAIGCIIYVPIGSVDAYKSARGWNWYESYIRGYDFDSGKYTVILNNAWQQSTSVSNPNSSLYDGVYESYSNYNVDSSEATMYIDIEGYTEFSIYVRSNAESNYDYVTVSELDSATQKMSTKGNQNSGTALSNYTKVTYTGIDGGSHRITVTYKKDGSQHSGTDRGYLIIPKYQ